MIEKDGWTVYRCNACGLGVLDPRPDRNELHQLYKKNYFDHRYNEGPEAGSAEWKRRISQEDHRIRFFRKLKKSGYIVDIGCGRGFFLYAARQAGYDVVGVDLSDYVSAYAERELNIPIKTGDIDTIDLPEYSFDVVTLWHSLEHTDDPRRYLIKVSRWIKPEGLLVIDVPNYNGTDARRMGINWADWDLPYHLFHFTPYALEMLLLQNGFEIIRSKKYHSETIKEMVRKIPLLGLFARLIAKAYSGSSYAVVARRRKNS